MKPLMLLSIVAILSCNNKKATEENKAVSTESKVSTNSPLIGKWRLVLPDPNPSDELKQSGLYDDTYNEDGTGISTLTLENSPIGKKQIYTIEYDFKWETSKNIEGKEILVIKTGIVKVKNINASDDLKSETESDAQSEAKKASNITINTDYEIVNGKTMYFDKKSGDPRVYTKID